MMLQSVFSLAGLQQQIAKTWEDCVLQQRNFQKGNRFASTEEAFRKGKMRYIYLPQGKYSHFGWEDSKDASGLMVVLLCSVLQVPLYKYLENLVAHSYFNAF